MQSLFFEPESERSDQAGHTGRNYLPGLDGLRALAVIAVLIYHARPAWLPGGYLGVEVFFVISGFIITRTLLTEWHEHGRIGLRAFWLRRARRLLPAVGLLLAAVMAYVAAFHPDELTRLRGDTLAALAYVTNWHLIVGDQSYFDSFQRPSMLRHLWSLAVEEQFYIVWPMVLAFGLPIFAKKGLGLLIILAIAGSAIGMALLYDPIGDNARAYFGTDTRAAGLMVGALLAFLITGRQLADERRGARIAMALLGVLALGGLSAATYLMDESSAFLYQGGFLVASLIASLVILAATQRNVFARALSLRPLRWIGVRSYGMYLWHWPIYMLVWPREATLTELALQIVAVVVISAASYRFLERPVREGALGRAWQGVRAWSSRSWRFRGAVVFSGASSAAVVVGLVAVAAMAKPPEVPPYFQTGSVRIQTAVIEDVGSIVRGPTLMGRVQTTLSALTVDERTCPTDQLSPDGQVLGMASTPFGSTCPNPPTLFDKPAAASTVDIDSAVSASLTPEDTEAALAALEPEPTVVVNQPDPTPTATPIMEQGAEGPDDVAVTPVPTQVATPPPPAAPPTTVPSVTAIGDSVMLGAAYTMAANIPGIDLDATVGRQADAAIALLQQKAAAGQLGQVVVMHLGNNGTLTSGQFDQVMAAIGPDKRVVFLNLHVPRAWQDSNNAVITDGVSRYGNAVLVDWQTAATTYGGMLYNDGIHLTPEGAAYYTQLVVAMLGGT